MLGVKVLMKLLLTLTIFISSIASAGDYDVVDLLKRDLGEQINFVSLSEIHYCPDNTCSIYKASKKLELLPTYVYLHIIHASGYTSIYRKPFIESAKESTEILNQSKQYCLETDMSAQCILNGIATNIEATECSGRYDEGYFCFSCKESENVCHKL